MTNKELFINGYLERISKKFNISKDEAFEVFSIAVILNQDFDYTYDNIITTGIQDGGIDGIYFEKIDDFQYNIHVFQCKNKSNLSANDLDKFKDNFDDIFIKGKNKLNTENLKTKIQQYKNITDERIRIKHKLYFIFNGLIEDNQTSNQQLFKEYNEGNFNIIDSNKLYNSIINVIDSSRRTENINFIFNPENSNIIYPDNQALYSYSINNIKAINFRIKTIDLCKLIELEEQKNGTIETLYSENIRSFLGRNTNTNSKMIDTINDDNQRYYFPFLNNGLTLICDELIIPLNTQMNKYIVQVKNPVIVNGLQTSRVLWDFYKTNPEKLEGIFVNLRIYQANNPELIDLITDATNNQNPIISKDKISNHKFNKFTKELFYLNGINYITKRGEIFKPNHNDFYLLEYVQNEIVLKFWYSTFYQKPEIAHKDIYYVLDDIYNGITFKNNPNIFNLFNGNENSKLYKQLLQSYYIYKYIKKKEREDINNINMNELNQKEAFFDYSDELLAYGIYHALENKDELKKDLDNEYKIASDACLEILNQEIEKYKNAEKTFGIASYFKKANCRIDYNRKMNILED